MGYVIAAVFVLLSLYKKDYKPLTIALFAYFTVLVGLNIGAADSWVYQQMYEHCFDPAFATHEPGFLLLCKLFYSIGFSFTMFRMVIALLMTFFTFKAIRYFTKNINYALALFLIFPFCGSPSGLRNALAGSIVLYAIHFLFEKKGPYLLKYFLMIVVATMFHYNSIFFLILPLAIIRKIKFHTMLIASLASIPLLVLLAKTNLPYTVISWFTSDERILNWFHFSFFFGKIYLFTLALAVFALVMLHYTRKFLPENPADEGLMREDVTVMAKMGALCLLSFSGAIFRSVVFLRLLTGLMPLFYAFLAETLQARETDEPKVANTKRFLRIGLPIFCGFLLWFVYGFWIGGDAIQNFQKNLLFSWL